MKPTTSSLTTPLGRGRAGFTLLEFLIVLTVAAIIASVAIPTWQDAAIRARVAEGLALAEPAKAIVSANAARGAPLSEGFRFSPAGTPVSSMTISADGAVTVNYGANAGNGSVVLNPSAGGERLVPGRRTTGPVTWRCNAAASRPEAGAQVGTLAPNHAPAECR